MPESTIEQLSPEQQDGMAEASRWIDEWDLARTESKEFRDDAKRLLDIYRDENSQMNHLSNAFGEGSYNIFWSNVNVLKPALYSRIPKPQVERRYKDKDPVGRVASQLLERALQYSITEYDFNESMFDSRDDWLIVGRGQAWVRYKPTITTEEELQDDGSMEVVNEELVYEEVACDHIHWSDFEHSPARCWSEVRWVAKRTYLTRDELIERFGKVGKKVPLTHTPKGIVGRDEEEFTPDLFKKGVVVELWHKPTREVIWFSPDFGETVLDKKEDPLGLSDFFPCPKPLYATITTDSLNATADYKMYQHQAKQLDRLNSQRAILIRSLKAAGVYDAQFDEIKRILEEGIDNQLIPVQDWPRFLESGGFPGVVQFMPLDDLVKLLEQIDASIEVTKQQLFEITGMSDLIRGVSAPHETATAQQIKGQFATLRLSDRQRDIQRFARDLIALKGEIISEKFEPQTIALMTGAYTTTNPETGEQTQVIIDSDTGVEVNFDEAIELLRSDPLRSFRISIETDSTLAIDEGINKQNRMEFLQHATNYVAQMEGVIQRTPQFTEVVGEMLLFAVRTFKAGRDLETAIEKTIGDLLEAQRQARENPQPQQPDPKVMAVQQAAQRDQAEMAHKQQELQIDVQKFQQSAATQQAEMTIKVQEAQSRIALEQEKQRNELNIQSQKIMADLQVKAEEFRTREDIETAKILAKQMEYRRDAPKAVKFFTDELGQRVAQIVGADGEDQDHYVFKTNEDGSRTAVPVSRDEPTQ